MGGALAVLSVGCLPELPVPSGDPCDAWVEPGPYGLTLEVGGYRRTARVTVPEGDGPRALVVNLHGQGVTATSQRIHTGYEGTGLEAGFVTVHPSGIGRSWNAGGCCAAAVALDVADVRYLDQLAAEVQDRLCVDRTLATGLSNGGMMAYQWSCASTVVDAIVPVAATLEADGCETGTPVPIRSYHGTRDRVVPDEGGAGSNGGDFRSQEDTLAIWLERNQCAATRPEIVTFEDVTCATYDCAVSTVFCTVEGGGHTWPGAPDVPALGYTTPFVSATWDGWSWFRDLPLGAVGR